MCIRDRILGYLVEGRRGAAGRNYRRLKNLEDAMPGARSKSCFASLNNIEKLFFWKIVFP